MPSAPGWPRFLSAMVLVMVRLSGLMVFAPVFSSEAIPVRVKALFVLAVSILIAPAVAGLPLAQARIGVLPVLGELSVGLIFGLCLSLLDEMLLFTGQILGIQFSFSLVNLLDPNSKVETPLLGQALSLLGTLVLLAAGLHRTLLAALLRSFAWAPLGGFAMDSHPGVVLPQMAAGIFLAALQLAAPVLAATMLVEFAVAMVGRLSPQLPVMSVAIPLKTICGYVVLIGSLALWPRFIEARFDSLLTAAAELVRHSAVQPGLR
ncbi:flagellar biosynthetic protein FliR [Paracidobacterium acidisoli]|uniref:Type III secretion protein n=1 Tax=Paracidobacterium acidisoli TaxID=2303751 RepID=A0A372IRN0_9BACT|nr:flagellar biosynthetic protein FliR [Paracidobacterium acidisoli]MBT9330301.1 flagellar biosynthetic protein FliR [Paracidobacterium acidisoli]